MNWLFVNGSPRGRGNTEYVFEAIKRARGAGAEPTIFLHGLELGPCVDCRACKAGGLSCPRPDGMAALYARLEASDRIVLGSPIYWSGVTGPMKNFLDRLRPYYKSGRLAGKELVTVTVGASGAEEADLIDAMYRRIAAALGLVRAERVVATAFDEGDLERAGWTYSPPGAAAEFAASGGAARLVELGFGEVGRVAELWELNRRHHEELTPHFKSQYRGMSFEERMAGFAAIPPEDLKISVVEEGGRAVGYCLSTIVSGRGELETLHVEEAARGKGYGKALVESHIAWMKARGCAEIGVVVLADNRDTLKVYRKLGFHPNTTRLQLV